MIMQGSATAGIPIPSAGRNGVRAVVSDHRSATSTPLGSQQHGLHSHSHPPAGGEGSSGSSETITSPTSSLTRQRRPRSRKDKEKRFTCDHPGCDKTYTRAEHLTRHQLNRIQTSTPLRPPTPITVRRKERILMGLFCLIWQRF